MAGKQVAQMEQAGQIYVEITGDTKGLERATGRARDALGQFQKTTQRTEQQASRSLGQVGSIAKTALAGAAAGAAFAALGAVQQLAQAGFRALAESVQLAGIQDIAEGKLAQALQNLSGEGPAAVEALKSVAAATQRFSNFGDEAIITAQAMLASFKSVGGSQGIALLTPRLADMAAGVAKVSGETADLNQIATALGKALEGGAGALKRYGVSLTEAEAAAIDAATGLERVQLLSEVLDANFAGLARATADPFVQLRNAIGDLQEVIGAQLLPPLREAAVTLTEFAQSREAVELMRQLGSAIAALPAQVIALRDTMATLYNLLDNTGLRVVRAQISVVQTLYGVIRDAASAWDRYATAASRALGGTGGVTPPTLGPPTPGGVQPMRSRGGLQTPGLGAGSGGTTPTPPPPPGSGSGPIGDASDAVSAYDGVATAQDLMLEGMREINQMMADQQPLEIYATGLRGVAEAQQFAAETAAATTEHVRTSMDVLSGMAQTSALRISDAFTQAIVGLQSWSDAWESTKNIVRQAIAQMMTEILRLQAMKLFGGGGAQGAAGGILSGLAGALGVGGIAALGGIGLVGLGVHASRRRNENATERRRRQSVYVGLSMNRVPSGDLALSVNHANQMNLRTGAGG